MGGELVGRCVDLASQSVAVAEADEIVMTSEVLRSCAELHAVGESVSYQLEGFDEPVELHRLLIANS